MQGRYSHGFVSITWVAQENSELVSFQKGRNQDSGSFRRTFNLFQCYLALSCLWSQNKATIWPLGDWPACWLFPFEWPLLQVLVALLVSPFLQTLPWWSICGCLSSQSTWPAWVGGLEAWGVGTSERSVGHLHFWTHWLGDPHSVSGRCGASAECSYCIVTHIAWGGGMARAVGELKSVSCLNSVLVLIPFAQRKGPHVTLVYSYFA